MSGLATMSGRCSMEDTVGAFYAGRSVFVTGFTGFMGKCLVEKLIRGNPELRSVYVLVRGKKDCTAQERCSRMLESSIFNVLKTDMPNYKAKVIGVEGDITLENLGLNQADEALLRKNVSIVMHCAATVKFDEKLDLAIDLNVVGLQRLIKLAKTFDECAAFVHTSTAFANCDKPVIEEMIYTPDVDPYTIIDASKNFGDNVLAGMTKPLLGKKPNTYTLTKSLAESILEREHGKLPAAIVRPSIVTATHAEPVKGWVENINGPGGIYIAVGKGILRVLPSSGETVADLIPVDFYANMMVSVAWMIGTGRRLEGQTGDIPVFNCTSGRKHPIKWREQLDIMNNVWLRYPSTSVFRYPRLTFEPRALAFKVRDLFQHDLPAYLTDMMVAVMGGKPRMVRTYGKMRKMIGAYSFFISTQWSWHSSNADSLKALMGDADKKLYNFDVKTIDWPSYIENFWKGIMTDILKEKVEDMNSISVLKTRPIRMFMMVAILALLYKLIISIVSKATNRRSRMQWLFALNPVQALTYITAPSPGTKARR